MTMNRKTYEKPALQVIGLQHVLLLHTSNTGLSATFMSGPGISGSRASRPFGDDEWDDDWDDDSDEY